MAPIDNYLKPQISSLVVGRMWRFRLVGYDMLKEKGAVDYKFGLGVLGRFSSAIMIANCITFACSHIHLFFSRRNKVRI